MNYMHSKNMEQLQIRIDSATKEGARKILDQLGMDLSTAVKIFLRQVINTKNFPCEIRDENGFTVKAASAIREAALDAKNSKKRFRSGKDLIKDVLS